MKIFYDTSFITVFPSCSGCCANPVFTYEGNQKNVAKSFVEQTLREKGLDPEKYRISNSEFNAAIGIAQLSMED